jgi:CHRD domain
VFFCTNLGNAPAGTSACPLNSGTVTGTWTKDNVVAIPEQNVNAGDFNALVDALTSNTAYANIHSTGLPNGELRGQVRSEEREKREKR